MVNGTMTIVQPDQDQKNEDTTIVDSDLDITTTWKTYEDTTETDQRVLTGLDQVCNYYKRLILTRNTKFVKKFSLLKMSRDQK